MSGVSQQELQKIIKGIATVMGERFSRLEKRILEIEKKGVEYKGIYQPAQLYERGAIVTYKGGMWHANVATRSLPGTNIEWTLCVKSGRDGKDAR